MFIAEGKTANSEKPSRHNSMSASVRKKTFLVLRPSFSPKVLLFSYTVWVPISSEKESRFTLKCSAEHELLTSVMWFSLKSSCVNMSSSVFSLFCGPPWAFKPAPRLVSADSGFCDDRDLNTVLLMGSRHAIGLVGQQKAWLVWLQ